MLLNQTHDQKRPIPIHQDQAQVDALEEFAPEIRDILRGYREEA